MPILKRRLTAAALGLAVFLTFFASGLLSPRPAPRYTITDLGVLPGYGDSHANAVNSRGDAGGSVSGPGPGRTQACLFQGGRLTNLGTLPGGNTNAARGVNSSDEMTGEAYLPTAHHAFLYSKGKMEDLGSLPGFTASAGMDINDQGEIVGDAMNNTGTSQGFLYSQRKMINLGPLLGCVESHARSINATGQIVGECRFKSGRTSPFLYDSRTQTKTLPAVPLPYYDGCANRANGSGQIIGIAFLPNGYSHAVLWQADRMTDLGTLPGDTTSIGTSLNNHGAAVGYSFRENSPILRFLRNSVGGSFLRQYVGPPSVHAFVYRDGRMQDLNTLLPTDADWMLKEARSINDQGQIVGDGLHHGQRRGFLLTPIH